MGRRQGLMFDQHSGHQHRYAPNAAGAPKPVCSSAGPVLKLTQVSPTGTDDHCCGDPYLEITNVGGAVATLDGYVLMGGNMPAGVDLESVGSTFDVKLRLQGLVPEKTSIARGGTLRVCQRRTDATCETGDASNAGVGGTRAAGSGGDHTADFSFAFNMTVETTVSLWDAGGGLVDGVKLGHGHANAFNQVCTRTSRC